MTFRDGALEGFRDAIPILLAVTPFGLVAGVSAAEVGLPVAHAVGMSYVVYAGTSQLAALQLLAVGSPFAVILLTTLLLNLRFALYSATLAPHVRGPAWPVRLWMAALMTDQSMALSTHRYATKPERGAKVAYYLGVSVPVWIVWTTAATVGVFVGAAVPDAWSLEFAVPLVFLTLWVLVLARGRGPVWWAGGVSAVVAIAARPLPFNLGLLLAAFAGLAAGVTAEALRDRRREPRAGSR
ncbi:MAG: AzlC family ABC transporter permease [Trueperaceae bacterium]|nr:AzlC family ABC transporter permease [Trueperaceae bacterium]